MSQKRMPTPTFYVNELLPLAKILVGAISPEPYGIFIKVHPCQSIREAFLHPSVHFFYIQALTPEPYVIDSLNFTHGHIISRSVTYKNDNLLSLFLTNLPLANNLSV